jgi:Family of unknown function (DUF6049)
VRRVATVVAIVLVMLAALPLGIPATGTAAAGPDRPPDPEAGPLSLRLTQMDPRLVTADGPQTLTVVGVLTNTGEVPVGELEIRVQRGQPLGTEGAVRDALDGSAGTDAVQPRFVPVPGVIAPGGQLPVRLAVLLRGRPDSSLALDATGVHELLVNVNGVPEDGARARLAAVRMLLPVLSLPPDPAAPPPVPRGPASSTVAPSAVTLLYPIADTPRRLSTLPGEPPLLTDDGLATALAPEGRLGGLVAALGSAPVGSPVRDATCLAVDPDLVETAVAMRSGYQVVQAQGPPLPGAGAEVAARWVDALTGAARGGCVLALPFADADLVALNRAGLGRLAVTAEADGRQLLAELLGTPIVGQVSWPVDGAADDATLDRIGDAGGRAVLLSADAVEQGRTQLRAGVVPLADRPGPQFAVLTDPLLSLAATGPRPSLIGTSRSTVPASTPAGRSTPLSTQDVIGALAFRARSGADRAGAPTVLAPPHQWAAEGAGATALLQAVDIMLEAGTLTPRPLDDVLSAEPPTGTPARAASYPLRAGGREVAGAVADEVRVTGADIEDLRSAAVADSGVGLSPDAVLQPLLRGLLRPVSAAWRGRPEAALAAVRQASGQVADLRGTVRVLEPPSPYALGTSDAPLLVTIGNGLPFTVRVRLEISSTSGLRVAPIEMQQVPPLGRRQTRVSAEVTRAGQFTVQATVRSPNGRLLGPPSRLRVRSTAYGTITVWLTASAGVLLVVLAVRRVLRRLRIEPPPHTGPIPVTPGQLRPERPAADPRPARRTDRGPHPDRPPPDPPSPDPSRTARPDPARPHPVPPRPTPNGRDSPPRTGDPFPDPARAAGPTPPPNRPRPRPRPAPAVQVEPTTPLRLARPDDPEPPARPAAERNPGTTPPTPTR